MRTIQDLAREAVQIQNACNPLGLSLRYPEVLQELCGVLIQQGHSADTNTIRNHPVNRMWVSKLHDLAGMGLSDTERYGEAYEWCKDVARIEDPK